LFDAKSTPALSDEESVATQIRCCVCSLSSNPIEGVLTRE
jgi:hypothetical protein